MYKFKWEFDWLSFTNFQIAKEPLTNSEPPKYEEVNEIPPSYSDWMRMYTYVSFKYGVLKFIL